MFGPVSFVGDGMNPAVANVHVKVIGIGVGADDAGVFGEAERFGKMPLNVTQGRWRRLLVTLE